MDYHELREVAQGLEGFTGYTQMRKSQILEAICKHQEIEMHDHHAVVGIDKTAVKKEIRELKVQREAALEARDHKQLRKVQRQIHRLKGHLRRATV
jgi:hypothetical protein